MGFLGGGKRVDIGGNGEGLGLIGVGALGMSWYWWFMEIMVDRWVAGKSWETVKEQWLSTDVIWFFDCYALCALLDLFMPYSSSLSYLRRSTHSHYNRPNHRNFILLHQINCLAVISFILTKKQPTSWPFKNCQIFTKTLRTIQNSSNRLLSSIPLLLHTTDILTFFLLVPAFPYWLYMKYINIHHIEHIENIEDIGNLYIWR